MWIRSMGTLDLVPQLDVFLLVTVWWKLFMDSDDFLYMLGTQRFWVLSDRTFIWEVRLDDNKEVQSAGVKMWGWQSIFMRLPCRKSSRGKCDAAGLAAHYLLLFFSTNIISCKAGSQEEHIHYLITQVVTNGLCPFIIFNKLLKHH